MGFLDKRRSSVPSAGGVADYPLIEGDRGNWPCLVQFLTAMAYEDKTARVTGTLGVSVEGGAVKVRFADRDAGLVAFRSVKSLQGILDAIEEMLAGDRLEWRDDQYAKKRR